VPDFTSRFRGNTLTWVSTTSFDHRADQRAGLADCARVLAPGGCLVRECRLVVRHLVTASAGTVTSDGELRVRVSWQFGAAWGSQIGFTELYCNMPIWRTPLDGASLTRGVGARKGRALSEVMQPLLPRDYRLPTGETRPYHQSTSVVS